MPEDVRTNTFYRTNGKSGKRKLFREYFQNFPDVRTNARSKGTKIGVKMKAFRVVRKNTWLVAKNTSHVF